MPPRPPLTAGNWLSAWTLDRPLLVVVAVLSVAYFLLAHRRPGWPWRRTACFATAMAVVIVATCSFLGAYDHILFWALSAQDVLLLALAPVPLVLSRPWELVRARHGEHAFRWSALAGSVVAVATLSAVYLTGLDQARLENHWLFAGVQVLLVAAGSCCVGPLLAERGATYGVRTLVAFIDGLLDAIPGLVVLGSHGAIAAAFYAQHLRTWGPSTGTDQQIGGSLMIALGELVGLPALLLTVARWIRSDSEAALSVDTELDAQTGDAVPGGPALGRPWWETDPGPLSERAERQGWTR